LRIAFALLHVLHGAIHLLGFAKGFGLSDVAALRLPIGRIAGSFWLLAAIGFAASATLLFAAPAHWWLAALPTLFVSQILIVLAWSDAKFGTIPNVVVLVPLLLAILQASPNSFRSTYRRTTAELLAQVGTTAPVVTGKELEPLPPILQAWLRRVGVVGQPHVRAFRARFHGRIRNGLDAPWMSFTCEQHNFVDPSARLFFIDASMRGIPFDGLHSFTGSEARMQIRVASLFDVVDGRGPEMNRGETVTIFNDLCVLAPAALLDVPVRWTEGDARSVRGTFTRGAESVSALLTFDPQGDLVDFVSEDRFLSADGKTFRRLPWSTPMRGHRAFGPLRLPAHGDATWKTPEGDFVYGEFDLDEIVDFPATPEHRQAPPQ
jgi:hypothetical protein